MIKQIIDLCNDNSDTNQSADKGLIILGDLLEDYMYAGEEPTKKEADRLSCEAVRILTFIRIAFDYVYDTKKDLKKACEDLDNLLDMAKAQKEAPGANHGC